MKCLQIRGKPSPQHPSGQKKRRHSSDQSEGEARHQRRTSSNSPETRTNGTKPMSPIGEDQIDLSRTYTGLDKRISEEFISIAMDPERKSKASSHHGSEIAHNTRK